MAYTTIDDPSEFFHTRLYTATGNAISVTNNANAGEEIDFAVEGLPSGWTYCVLFSGNCLNSLNIVFLESLEQIYM